MKNKVTLYIATHNTTGLKYFGKTTRYFTKQELQEKYHGSGLRWKRHLNKHSDDVTMEIYGIYDLETVEHIALSFSLDNDIVKSNDWANLMLEDGKTGGNTAICINYNAEERARNIKKAVIKRYGKFTDFEVICHKCGEITIINERDKTFPKKEKYFCSRSCANSKTPTKEANERREIS